MSRDRRQRESRRRSRKASEGENAPDANAPDANPSEEKLSSDFDGGFVRSLRPAALRGTGDVEEFDAALARGAGGSPAPLDDADLAEAEEQDERERERAAPAAGGGGNGRGGDSLAENPFGREDDDGGAGLPIPRDDARRGGGSLPSRAVAFGRASWAELQRVQWPDREQVFQATAVVLGFVAVAGVFLFAADWVAEHIIKAIL